MKNEETYIKYTLTNSEQFTAKISSCSRKDYYALGLKTMLKKGDLYFPDKKITEKAWVKSSKVYKKANRNPIKFWEKLGKELFWFKEWKKGFIHKPPYFQWFVNGKLNITYNCLDKNLEKNKNKVALIWEPENTEESSRIITYYELFRQVNKLANGLKKLGVKKGDRIGIYLPMIPEVIISMLACARIGAIHVVVFSAFSPSALRVRLEDTGAKVLITADGYYRRGKIINLKENALSGVRGTKVKNVIVVKRADNRIVWRKEQDIWWNELIKYESDWCKAEVMDSEDTLFILYTSGSTGRPKGVVHTCGGYAVQAKFTGKWIFDWKDTDIFWSMADVGWITGHTYSCYGNLLNGLTLVIFEGAPDWPCPDRWAQIIEEHGVTIFYTAPTAIRMFEKYGAEILKKYNFDTLRILGSVGEPFDEAAWWWYFTKIGNKKCPIVDTWWQTETGGILITALPGIGPFKASFTGMPFPGIKVDILDEKGKSLPAEKEGNLVLLPPFSPGLLRGVYKNPKKYKETYWKRYGKKVYFTSDKAYKDKNGLIRIVGRADDVIKVAGHRLSTGELEAIINLHPEITECAVIGIPDEIRGQVPAAFVIYKSNKSREDARKDILSLTKKKIGPIAGIKEVFVVDSLPKTRSGKIMRRILRKLWTGEKIGDISTLANPEAVDEIRGIIKRRQKID